MALTATLISKPGTQGIAGPRIRYGSGAPTAATPGNNGDTYLDVAGSMLYGPMANGVWPSSGKSTVGLRGPVGATPLAAANLGVANAVVAGPVAGFGVAVPLAAGFTTLVSPGTTRASTFFSGNAICALQGGLLVNQGTSASAVTFQLLRSDTGAVIYTSASVPAGSVTSLPTNAFAQAPSMPKQGIYVWQISPATANATVSAAVYPFYYAPGDMGPAPSYYARAGLTSGTITASSGQTLFLPGDDTQVHYYKNPRPSAVYGAVLNNQTPQAITFSIGSYTSPSVAANTTMVVGPLSPIPTANRLAANTNYQWSIAGFSGTISNAVVTADLLVVV